MGFVGKMGEITKAPRAGRLVGWLQKVRDEPLLSHHHDLAGGEGADFHHVDTGGEIVVADVAARHIVDVHLVGRTFDHDAAGLDVNADASGVDVIDAVGATSVGGEVSYEVEVLGHRQRVGVDGAVVTPVVEVVAAVGGSVDDGLRAGAGGHGEDLHGALLFIGRRSGEGEALLLYEVGEITPA